MADCGKCCERTSLYKECGSKRLLRRKSGKGYKANGNKSLLPKNFWMNFEVVRIQTEARRNGLSKEHAKFLNKWQKMKREA